MSVLGIGGGPDLSGEPEGRMGVRIWLCPPCGGYTPLTDAAYHGGLTGDCDRCGKRCREVHRFGLSIDVSALAACECTGSHDRRETI